MEKPAIGNLKIEEMRTIIYSYLELIRNEYLETKDKMYWNALVELLPESWLQKRTVTLNYENIRNMYFQRRNHKLTEWRVDFVDWVESLPYAEELITAEWDPAEPLIKVMNGAANRLDDVIDLLQKDLTDNEALIEELTSIRLGLAGGKEVKYNACKKEN